MATPKGKTWQIKPHTIAKHKILDHYLKTWFAIMINQNFEQLIYFDGFCGPSIYDNGELGSPLVALNAALKQKIKLKNEVTLVTATEIVLCKQCIFRVYDHSISKVFW